MNVSSKLLTYSSKLFHAAVKPGQLANIARRTCLRKTEVVRWQPTHVALFVTSHCNLRCDMCPTHSKVLPKDYLHRHLDAADMSLELLRVVLDRYPRAMRAWLIGVGEPLLSPAFFELVRECCRRNLVVDTVSNGVALDNHVQEIVHSRLDRIYVSLNGHTAKEFQRMTGMPQSVHSKVLGNIEALVSARGNTRRPRIELSFIVDRANYCNIDDMIRVAEELGVDGANFYNYVPTPYPGFTAGERCLYEDDPAVCDELVRLMSRKWRCDVAWPCLLRRFDSMSPRDRTRCRWLFSVLQVDGDGNVGGCTTRMLNMHANGKVTDGDAWNNEYFREARSRHLNGDVMEACKACSECVGVAAEEIVRRGACR